MNSRTSLALLASGLFLPACSVTQPQTAAEPQVQVTAGDYGVVADPPLPRSEPVVPLSNENTLADHDGSVVVSLAAPADDDDRAMIRFVEEEAIDDPIEAWVDVGTDAELRAVSADGSRAALFERLAGPIGETSRITVIDRSAGVIERSVYDLSGLVEPEAFSTDGEQLFVIDHSQSSSEGPTDSYRVRPFDLATGELQEILGPTKVPFDDAMNGVGRRQVWSPEGDRLYTLYIRQTHHHHQGEDATSGHGHPEPGTDGFVHVLDLGEEWAFCLDLPPAFGGGELASTALAISPDGQTVAVADLAAGAVAFASTTDLAVIDIRPLPEVDLDVEPDDELHLGLSGQSMLFLASGSAGRWHDGDSLQPITSEPTRFRQPVRGLTSLENSVLVWTTDLSAGPTEISRPIP